MDTASIVKKHAEKMAKKTFGNHVLDENDYFQEGIIGLLSALSSYVPGAVPPYAYAAKRVVGQMHDARRKSLPIKKSGAGPFPEQPLIENIDDAAISKMHENLHSLDADTSPADLVGHYLKKLRPTQQRLMENIYFKEMEKKDLARELGITLEKLWWKEQNALKDLRNLMKADGVVWP